MDVNVILQVATLAVVTVGGYLLRLGKTGLEEGVKASAQKGAEVAIENYNWPQKLSQELQKVRGAERQELRFKAYGLLWSKQRPPGDLRPQRARRGCRQEAVGRAQRLVLQ
jgi:hypothetical protein